MNQTNTNLTFKGNPLKVSGKALQVGDALPKFKLVSIEMQDITNDNFNGQPLILSVIPSIDTPVCQIETKKFNEEATKLSDNIRILTISVDLPFAQKRWCAAEGVSKVVMLSDYKYHNFGEPFGVMLPDLGLLARAVFVVDKNQKIVHVEYVPEIGQEPNYDTALAAVKGAA